MLVEVFSASLILRGSLDFCNNVLCAVSRWGRKVEAVGGAGRRRACRFRAPEFYLGLSNVRIEEVTISVPGGIIRGVMLRRDPPDMRVYVGREAVGAPLPADAEEGGGAGAAFCEGKNNGHGIAEDEVVSRKIAPRPTQMLESAEGCAGFENDLRFISDNPFL